MLKPFVMSVHCYYYIFMLIVLFYSLTLQGAGGGPLDPPPINTQIAKNWRRPKACAFLSFNLIYFYTFCAILGVLGYLEVKIWFFCRG